ncbi:MAG: hypothetical protein IJX02_08630 [Clostridia bacterium]|nr:hypothetical protein [Clostridia bacterium]
MKYIAPEYVIEGLETKDIVLSSRATVDEKDSGSASVSMSIFNILGLS